MSKAFHRTSPTQAGFFLAGLIFLIDQLTKLVMVSVVGLKERGDAGIELLKIFRFTYAENRGISLGMFEAGDDTERWILVAVLTAITLLVGRWLTQEQKRPEALALGAIVGGALGNLLDRVRLGYVVDFLDLHFGDFRPFMIFNVADMAITCGVLVLVWRALREGRAGASNALHGAEGD